MGIAIAMSNKFGGPAADLLQEKLTLGYREGAHYKTMRQEVGSMKRVAGGVQAENCYSARRVGSF